MADNQISDLVQVYEQKLRDLGDKARLLQTIIDGGRQAMRTIQAIADLRGVPVDQTDLQETIDLTETMMYDTQMEIQRVEVLLDQEMHRLQALYDWLAILNANKTHHQENLMRLEHAAIIAITNITQNRDLLDENEMHQAHQELLDMGESLARQRRELADVQAEIRTTEAQIRREMSRRARD
ncbi:hypothetical protein V499_01060 [Pseudogymnoascus sp. VKM F-103]|nr:hypothetical protein V499_01060 [Pseudogymnoascus sp. VKM F-103]